MCICVQYVNMYIFCVCNFVCVYFFTSSNVSSIHTIINKEFYLECGYESIFGTSRMDFILISRDIACIITILHAMNRQNVCNEFKRLPIFCLVDTMVQVIETL